MNRVEKIRETLKEQGIDALVVLDELNQHYLSVFSKIERRMGADVASNLHCHFSKIEWTDKGEKRHLTFDDTIYGPDYRPFAEAIKIGGLAPTVICESAGTQSDDALLMKKYYGDLK